MRIDRVNVYSVCLPFRVEFSHSRKNTPMAENIVVEVIAEGGTVTGYGEGAPRPYVTGETQADAVRAVSRFCRHDRFPWDGCEESRLWGLIDSFSGTRGTNSALCALETALLDASGKTQARPLADYFPRDFATDRVCYGATVPLADAARTAELCSAAATMGIRIIRMKMGPHHDRNRAALAAARTVCGEACDVRVDVNGGWDRSTALAHVDLLADHGITVVEQPLTPGDPHLEEVARAMHAAGMVLMADESACCLADVDGIIARGLYGMVNVRLSKCGGLRNSLRIIGRLRDAGIRFQVGCQLGESGILSAAGRAACLLNRDAVYCDGSYDAFILKENLTRAHVAFGRAGEAGPLEGHGLGVEVDPERLERLSDASATVSIDNPHHTEMT